MWKSYYFLWPRSHNWTSLQFICCNILKPWFRWIKQACNVWFIFTCLHLLGIAVLKSARHDRNCIDGYNDSNVVDCLGHCEGKNFWSLFLCAFDLCRLYCVARFSWMQFLVEFWVSLVCAFYFYSCFAYS